MEGLSCTIRTAIGIRTGMDRFTAYVCRWPVCCDEQVEQTLSVALADKTVQEVLCLLFRCPPDCEFLLGRANPVLDAFTE